MHAPSLLVSGLLVATAMAVPGKRRDRVVRRQDGPVDDGTVADCTFWDTALDQSYTCAYFEEAWGLSHDQFVEYNPGVKEDCSGIKVGNSYCMEVNFGIPTDGGPTSGPTSTTTSKPTSGPATTVASTTGSPSGSPKPSPIQDGLIDSCTQFYMAQSGDTCNGIVDRYGTFTFAEFLEWNPAVGEDCSGLWAETYYCVGIPGTPTSKPTTTKPTSTGSPKPSPIQDGLIDSCTKFYLAQTGDTCNGIVDRYGTFTFAEFLEWNPAVGEDCSGLWAETYYCVGIPGTPTTKLPTPTGNPKPSPTQEGLISTCVRFYEAKSGDTCDGIVAKYGTFTSADFLKWNPAVGKDCSGLWAETYYCVGIPGTPTTTTKTPEETCNPSAPTPTQPGAVCGCKKWHKVASGDTCATIAKQYSITQANFNKWNPEVGSDCKNLWLGYTVCVGK